MKIMELIFELRSLFSCLFIFVVCHGNCDVIYANNVKLMLSSRRHRCRNVNNSLAHDLLSFLIKFKMCFAFFDKTF